MMPALNLMRERFAHARIGRLATVTSTGAAHVVPFVFALSDETIYSCIDHKPKRTNRLRRLTNIEANPAVSILVDHYSDTWDELWWVRVDGIASVIDAQDPQGVHGIDVLAEKYRHYRDRRPTGPVVAVRDLSWHAWSARDELST
ncbi:TIGR03668 family PPOX class F420-dependent oxidoreductase [Gordonia sp. NPDC003504]